METGLFCDKCHSVPMYTGRTSTMGCVPLVNALLYFASEIILANKEVMFPPPRIFAACRSFIIDSRPYKESQKTHINFDLSPQFRSH